MPETIDQSQAPGVETAFTPYPLVPHVTKTIRFREEFLFLIKKHADAMTVDERRSVSQSEIIDIALTQFFSKLQKMNSTQIDMFAPEHQQRVTS